jgi:DNA-directed RNA polymerase specialized sigma24 family protein
METREAMKEAKTRPEESLPKHADDSVYRRRNRRREELRAAGELPSLGQCEPRQEAFFELVRPILPCLENHAQRELRRLEEMQNLAPGDVTARELTDEVLARAWSAFQSRSDGWRMDLWLGELLDELVNRIEQEPEVLSAYVPLSRIKPLADDDLQSEYFIDHALVTLAGALPGDADRSRWDARAREEMSQALETALSQLEPHTRCAVVQRMLEGYTPAEIAQRQNRTEHEVCSDLEVARRIIRRQIAGARVPK